LGQRGAYSCEDAATDVKVPATAQAAIAARIDRLDPDAKLTINAAAVIGLRFDGELLGEMADSSAVEPLLDAELIDQVMFTPRAEYAFRHPLIRTVAYQSQLKSDRGGLHRRLAGLLEACDPGSADESAALIAEHLEAAGDLDAAYGWHMRAGAWLTFRDIVAARLSWQRARDVADRLPTGASGREPMRIAPRALLCASSFRLSNAADDNAFDELRRLAGAADDKVSMAIAVCGQTMTLAFKARYEDAERLGTELEGLVDDVGDPGLSAALLCAPLATMVVRGRPLEGIRLSRRVIEMTGGDPRMGNLVIESPLALASIFHAAARMCLGEAGWREDLDDSAKMARQYLPVGLPTSMIWTYAYGVMAGAVSADATAVKETAEMYEGAVERSDDSALESARFLVGFTLAQQDGSDRAHGLSILAEVRDAPAKRYIAVFSDFADIEFAKEAARAGDLAAAIATMEAVLENDRARGGSALAGCVVEALVEMLLARGLDTDIDNAQKNVDRLSAMRVEPGHVVNEIPLLRLHALLAHARGDEAGYRHYRDRYRIRAAEVAFEGHIAKAEAMA
jgi:adenylate cyclase